MSGATPPLLDSLNRDGFVVVPSILTPEELSTLREAAAHSTSLAREGRWPYIRTVGKQFPPWPSEPGPRGIWGVQHMMHPEMAGSAMYTQTYFSEPVLRAARELMSCGDDELVMELCNMLVRPAADYELRWHRDDVPPEATAGEELERLREPAWHAQWNLALFDDESLVVVPGSHARARTDAERNAAPLQDPLPGQMVVRLKPGDMAFYNNNILHRGVYDLAKERMTLHGAVAHARGDMLRARNVLQHGVGGWVDKCDFSRLEGKDRRRAEAMRERLVRMGRESGDVGYSLKD